MTRRLSLLARRAAPLLAAGMLLQAGGCAVDTTALATGLLTSILQSLIGSLVYGSFNLVSY